MTDPARERWRALAWFAAAAAGSTGLFDVVRGGAGLSSFESLQSVALWLLLSIPIWASAACVTLLRKTRARSTGTSLIAAAGPSIVVLALVHAALAPKNHRASFDHAERLAEGFTTLAEALGRAGCALPERAA